MSENKTVIGLGEILWDVFPDGPRFGGAPANFACSAAALGNRNVRVYMASCVGRDELGDQAISTLQEKSVDVSYVMRSEKPTGQVLVQLDAQGHARYEFAANAAWDNLAWSNDWEQLASETDACCFGTLAQRSEASRHCIQTFLSKTPDSAIRVFDINLRPPFFSESIILESLSFASVLKLNDEELPVLVSQFGFTGTDIEVMQQLASRFSLSCVALTRGPKGAVLVSGDTISTASAVATQIVDTVGAGDAFTAALTLGLIEGGDLDVINRTACRVAAFVCSQPGATPRIPPEIVDR